MILVLQDVLGRDAFSPSLASSLLSCFSYKILHRFLNKVKELKTLNSEPFCTFCFIIESKLFSQASASLHRWCRISSTVLFWCFSCSVFAASTPAHWNCKKLLLLKLPLLIFFIQSSRQHSFCVKRNFCLNSWDVGEYTIELKDVNRFRIDCDKKLLNSSNGP